MAFGLGGWLLSVTGAAERALAIAARFRVYVAQPSAFQIEAAQPSPIAMKAAQPRAFAQLASQPRAFSQVVAGFQTDLENEENVAKKIWTDAIDQAVDAMPDGVVLYKTGGIWSATALTMDMIGPAFAATLSGGGLVEDGGTVTNPAFTASYTSTPTSVTIHDTQNATPATVALPATSFTRTGVYVFSGLGTTKTFTLTASNATTSDTDTATYTTAQRVYYGAATPGTYNEAFMEALSSSVLKTSRSGSYAFTVTAGQRCYLVLPTAMGTPTIVIDGFETPFTSLGTANNTNANGVVIGYTFWASDLFAGSDSFTAVAS